MPGVVKGLRRLAADQSGVAAVETAITVPFLLLLFFGVVNVADYVSSLNRLYKATALVGDLVARNDAVITSADLEDYFIAATLSLGVRSPERFRIEVQALTKSDGVLAAAPRWSRGWGRGECGPAGVPSLADAIPDGRDIILTVACMDYAPPVASFLGNNMLGFAAITMRQQVAMIPHQSATLSCNDC
jgi:hypothetical protein